MLTVEFGDHVVHAFGDELAHRQEIIGNHVEPAHRLPNIVVGTADLDPTHLGVRRGETLRETIEREREHTALARESPIALEWLQRIVEEHLVCNECDAELEAQFDEMLPLAGFDVLAGRIVRIDHNKRTDVSACLPVPFQYGPQCRDVHVPGTVELQLVFHRLHAAETCDRFDERVTRFRREHRLPRIT